MLCPLFVGRKIALLIGNRAYHHIGSLQHPEVDILKVRSSTST